MVCHAQREGATEDDGDGVRKVHTNTSERRQLTPAPQSVGTQNAVIFQAGGHAEFAFQALRLLSQS